EVSRCVVDTGNPASRAISVSECALPSVKVMRMEVILLVTDRPDSVELPAIRVLPLACGREGEPDPAASCDRSARPGNTGRSPKGSVSSVTVHLMCGCPRTCPGVGVGIPDFGRRTPGAPCGTAEFDAGAARADPDRGAGRRPPRGRDLIDHAAVGRHRARC